MDCVRLIVFLINIIFVSATFYATDIAKVEKVAVVSQDGEIVGLQIEGENFYPTLKIRTTESFESCEGPDFTLPGSSLFFGSTKGFLKVKISIESSLFLCFGSRNNSEIIWMHQGFNGLIPGGNKPIDKIRSLPLASDDLVASMRRGREERSVVNRRQVDSDAHFSHPVKLYGMRVESSDSKWGEDGVVNLLSHTTVTIRLFGEHLSSRTMLAFTSAKDSDGSVCEFPSSDIFRLVQDPLSNRSAVVEVIVPGKSSQGDLYFLCLKNGNGSISPGWRHQGNLSWLHFRVYDKLLPVWATAIIIVMLLCFSALFSGLTLGLMSMDKTDLKILCNTGKELERKYAAAIIPVRSHGSLLLCSLLLGNVLVNSVLTILMDDLTSGLVAVIFSTLAIVIFGEIMPQAVCSRHGLAVGARTIIITKIVIGITAIVAWPISKVLDYMLGEEIGNVYNRERLNELVKTGTDIEKDEVNIISGALQLSKKTVASVMTKLEDVYMLAYDTLLDFEMVSEIMNSGYSRIPVYEGNRSNIITLLFIKDLAFVDPDDNTPLRTLCEFYQNACYFIFEDMTLDVLFKKFKEGTNGHMAFVQRVNAEGEGDPFYETLGIITLEDVIEELIQAEIVDETDVWTDNRSKRKREKIAKSKDFAAFAEKRENQRIHISPHMTLATFQYLSTSVDPFKSPVMSETILRRMLQQDVYRHIKAKNKDRETVYQQGRTADYFVLILEGRVEVLVGKENMRFESGPFTYFGVQALQQQTIIGGESPTSIIPASATGSLQSVNTETNRHPFVPDYTVRPTTELFYVLIKRSLYVAARRATRLELCKKAGDHFDDEVDKLLHIDDDDRSQVGSQSSRRTSQCDKESPSAGEPWPGENANGQLPGVKTASEPSDPEERTTLLDPALS